MGVYDIMTGSQRCQDKGSGFPQESYAEKLWTEELHHVFALEAYLGHVSDASGSLCLVAVSYLDICVSCSDKPLWLDGYL